MANLVLIGLMVVAVAAAVARLPGGHLSTDG